MLRAICFYNYSEPVSWCWLRMKKKLRGFIQNISLFSWARIANLISMITITSPGSSLSEEKRSESISDSIKSKPLIKSSSSNVKQMIVSHYQHRLHQPRSVHQGTYCNRITSLRPQKIEIYVICSKNGW